MAVENEDDSLSVQQTAISLGHDRLRVQSRAKKKCTVVSSQQKVAMGCIEWIVMLVYSNTM